MLRYLILFFALSFSTPLSADERGSEPARIIDFYLFYPIIQMKDQFKKRQQGAAGVGFNYQWFFNNHFGVVLNSKAWFFPVRKADQKAMIVTVSAETGAVIRFFPQSYFDPSIGALGGVSVTDAGSTTKVQLSYPMGGRVGVNLYRSTQRFTDNQLALHAFGDYRYYLKGLTAIKSQYFAFGLAFRGSF